MYHNRKILLPFFYLQLLLGLVLTRSPSATAIAATTTTRHVRTAANRSNAAATATTSTLSSSEAIFNNRIFHRNLGVGSVVKSVVANGADLSQTTVGKNGDAVAQKVVDAPIDSDENFPSWLAVVICIAIAVVLCCACCRWRAANVDKERQGPNTTQE